MCHMWLQGRQQGTDSNQEAFTHESPGDVQSFLDAVSAIKPTAIIGVDLLINLFIYLYSCNCSFVALLANQKELYKYLFY